MATQYECYRCGYVSTDRMDFSLNIDMPTFVNSTEQLPSVKGLCGGCYEDYEMGKNHTDDYIKQWANKIDTNYTRPEE